MEIPDAVKWCSKKLNFEFGSPHPPVESYVKHYFTGKIVVLQRKQGLRQEPTEGAGDNDFTARG